MKDNLDHIEELFRDSFENFKPDVDPSLWNNIASRIGHTAPAPDPGSASNVAASSSTTATVGITKIALIAGTAGLIAVGSYVVFGGGDDDASSNDNDAIKVEEKVVAPKVQTVDENLEEEFEINNFNAGTDPSVPETQVSNETAVRSAKVADNQNSEAVAIGKTTLTTGEKSGNAKEIVQAGAEKKSVSQTPSNAADKVVPTTDAKPASTPEKFEASIYASVTSGKQPLEVRFENRGSYSDDIRWRVGEEVFEDGTEQFVHIFNKTGDFWVVLEIRNDRNQRSTDSTLITVKGKAHIQTANVFTPNGDGINDSFTVTSQYIRSLECIIMDVNGRPLFRWNDVNGQWDGHDLSGRMMPAGTYYFIIQAIDMDGNRITPEKGTVTLIRN